MSAGQKEFTELRETFRSGKTRSLEWREAQLAALRKGIQENSEMLIQALHNDLRRPTMEAVQELLSTTAEAVLAQKSVKKWAAPVEVPNPPTLPNVTSILYSKPQGVVLIICPFNFPIGLAFRPLIGAIAAGNCCVVKPSEMTPNSAKAIQHVIEKYLDPSAIQVVQGAVKETTELLQLPFDHFFYTGNGRVGKIVMKAAAEHLAPCTLELGGKSPVYVHEDANIDIAAKRLMAGKFMNNGQICISADYLLVHEKVRDQLINKMKAVLVPFFGPNKDGMGRLVNEHHFDRVKRLLEDKHGGKVVEGDLNRADRSSKYIPPTFVLDPSLSSKMMSEEIFGPVLPIFTVSGVDQALEIVLGKENPLAAYVFTENDQVAERFLNNVPSGSGCVNDIISQLRNPNLPFGGTGKSGLGSYHGKFTFDCFSHKQSVVKCAGSTDEGRIYPPYSSKVIDMLKANL